MILVVAAMCLALFSSCEKQAVPNTGDTSGNLYGVWALVKKTETSNSNNTGSDQTTKETDYSSVNFYLAIGEFPFPHAIAKKGSFTTFDLDDVDVDGTAITYNKDMKKISFKERLWLSDEFLSYNMILKGTFDVLELTDENFVIKQDSDILGTTTYHYKKYK